MLHDRHADEVDIVCVDERLEIDHLAVAAAGEPRLAVEHVRDAAAHPRGEIAARPSKDDHAAAGHVFAGMVADAFDHHVRAAVADAEALARHAAHVRLAAGRAVERDVADNNVVLGSERRALRRIRDHLAA